MAKNRKRPTQQPQQQQQQPRRQQRSTRPLVILALLSCLLAVVAYRSWPKTESLDELVIAGYLPEYRSYINLNNTTPHLSDVILFSLTPTAQGGLGSCCLEPHHFTQAQQARSYKEEHFPQTNKLRIWVSVGGAGRSNAFPQLAANRGLREKFLESLKELCVKNSIDGVDFDWEAPQDIQQYHNYAALLEDASWILRRNKIFVSVALHPQQSFPKPFSFDAVDRVNLMTYDMVEPNSHHATPEKVRAATDFLLKSGCPASKIVMGIPAYARHGNNPAEVKTYSEIVDRVLESDPSTIKESMANLKEWQGFLFDSPVLVGRKVIFADRAKLAGVFFWELGQDKQHEEWATGGILLDAAGQALELLKKEAKKEL